MKDESVMRDERTVVVENSSYRWAYLVLSFGLLAAVAYRGFVRGEASWDLLALVILGGLVTTGYQAAHRVLSRRWVSIAFATALLAGAVAAALTFIR